MRHSSRTRGSAGLLLLVVAAGACSPAPAAVAAGMMPVYEVDGTWPPELPNNWILGDVRGLFMDERDHLWVIHMPSSLTSQEIGAALDPPIAECCVPAPPVLELDPQGNVVQAWGGPGEGYVWPDQEHGIFLDHNGFIWVGTSTQNHVMKFTRDGRHVLTIGEADVNRGSNDPDHLGGPAAFHVDPETNEIFIADGYRNRRVIVFDAETGQYRRHWGAYGEPPEDDYRYPPRGADQPPPRQYSTVHGLVGSHDKLIYVSDRRGNRVQVFRQSGEYLMERLVAPETLGSGSGFSLALSRDPGQRFLYLIDGTNNKVWILERESLEILGSFGRTGRQLGQFIRAHMVVLDSQGNLYTGEAGNGRRLQRFNLAGSAAP